MSDGVIYVTLVVGFGFVIVLGLVSLWLASNALRTRMTRT